MVELWSELDVVQQVTVGRMLTKLRSVMINSAHPFHALRVTKVQHLADNNMAQSDSLHICMLFINGLYYIIRN